MFRESIRDAWGWTWLDGLRQDTQHAMRAFAANPGFAATAVLSLALGIGANTAIFSIINAVMLRSLPVEDPGKLVQVAMGENGTELTNPIWEQIRDHQSAFSGAFAYSQDRFDLAAGGESHFAEGLWVSGDYFRVLGVPAMAGRVFTRDDDRHGGGSAGPVAVISYSFWKRRFGGDPSAIGRTLVLDRHPVEIVGITPAWFTGLNVDRGYDVALPIGCQPILSGAEASALNQRSWWWLLVLGRIAPGESLQQAGDRIKALGPDVLRATLPAEFEERDQADYLKSSFTLRPAATGFSATGTRYRTALLALMAIAGLVLLIACANIANLLLARASARQRELAVRMAIGAGRPRIIRQLMTESLLLALFGAGGGLLLALWVGKLLIRALSTTGNTLEIDLSPDLRVLAFTVAAAVLTALLFGLAPAFRATRGELSHALKETARGAIRGSSRFHLGKAMVSGQVALSLMLLVGASLFLGTLRGLLTVDAGFNRRNVLLITVNTAQAATDKTRRAAMYREILDRVRSVPGVAAAASSFTTPIGNRGWNDFVQAEGFTPKSREDTLVWFNRVSPGYFKTLETPLLAGRDFDDHDDLGAPPVMIVNASAARHFFRSANPIGKTIATHDPGLHQDTVYQVVGIVKDAKYRSIGEETRGIAYVASGQDPRPSQELRYEVRSLGPTAALIPRLRPAIAGVNRDISLEFRDLETQVKESLLQPRIMALLSSVFGGLALLLAMIGIYGVTSFAVARRRSEIGIRVALGAQYGSVIWLVLRDVLLLLALGMSACLASSLAAGRLVASLLFGIQPNSLAHLAAAAAVLTAATTVAAWLPARRAARLDPVTALREE